MKLSEVKGILKEQEKLEFKLENGTMVPQHFHVTEIGEISKTFIDCGGVIRHENRVNFQLWNANDIDHRLNAAKLLSIIELSESKLGIKDGEIEVEYQQETIGKFGLAYQDGTFILVNKQTDCLAKDNCGIPSEKKRLNLKMLQKEKKSCLPGGNCC